MKTVNRSRYRPPARWPLYRQWSTYEPQPAHRHKWCRVSGTNSQDAVIICFQCGETQ